MLFSAQPGKSIWLFFLLLSETSTLLQVEATYRKQSREWLLRDNCLSFVIFAFFRRGLLTSIQRTNLHWKTNVLCYSWTNSWLFLQFRKTLFWLKQVRSYASMLQGIFLFWARIKINKGPNWEKWCHIDLVITQALTSLRHLAWWMGCDWLTVGCFEWVLIRPWCQTTACVN